MSYYDNLFSSANESKSLFTSSNKLTLQHWSKFGTSLNGYNEPCIRLFVPLHLFPIPFSKLYNYKSIFICMNLGTEQKVEIKPILHVGFSNGVTRSINKYFNHFNNNDKFYNKFYINNYRKKSLNNYKNNSCFTIDFGNSDGLKMIIINAPFIKKISYDDNSHSFTADSLYFNEFTPKFFTGSSDSFLPENTYLIPSLSGNKYKIYIECSQDIINEIILYTAGLVEVKISEGNMYF